MAVEYPPGSGEALVAADGVLRLAPDCYLAHDEKCRAGGIANLHTATLAGPLSLSQHLPVKLKALDKLPAGVREGLDRWAGGPQDFKEPGVEDATIENEVIEALKRAGGAAEDRGEPSWGVLAHLIRETRFMHVYRRLYFMHSVWNVPVEDYWKAARPYVDEHRYRPLLEMYALPPADAAKLFSEFANRVDLTDLEYTESPLWRTIERSRTDGERRAGEIALAHSDPIARDFAESTQVLVEQFQVAQARNLLAVAPNSTFAMSVLIDRDWDAVQDKIPGWLETAGDSPPVLAALARHYTPLKRFDEAKVALSAYIAQLPERWAYEMLAGNYKAQGDDVRWRETLEEYLEKGEDRGLDRAYVRADIANHLMDQKRWAEARPFAEAASRTGAGWAMTCAGRCYEGLGEWDEAELMARMVTERYSDTGSWGNWYLFCKRTGHGDVEAALDWAGRHVKQNETRPDRAHPETVAYFYWTTGAREKALETLSGIPTAQLSEYSMLGLALLADELGDEARRDATFEQICVIYKERSPMTAHLCQMFRDVLAKGGGRLDLIAADRLIEAVPSGHHGSFAFFVGRFLRNRGRRDASLKYMIRCADSQDTYAWWKVMAADASRPDVPPQRP